MNPQLIADLEAARALIDTPEKWIKGMGAHSASGMPVSIFGPDAVSFSIVGAYARSCGRGNVDREYAVICALRAAMGVDELMYLWNDAPERTHAEVLELFDKAIANERSKA